MKVEDKDRLDEISTRIASLSEQMQGMNIAEYVELVRSPRRMIYVNFVSGLARGLGVAVGATVLGALVLYGLFRLADLNVPVIGFFIAKIVKIVQTYL